MKVGISTFVTDSTMKPDVLAKEIELRGFESVFFPEHSHVPVSRETSFPFGDALPEPYLRAWDPFVALAAAGVATATLLLGTGVMLLVQRDVIQTAKEVACLDMLSSGRLMVGVGAGWNQEEMRNHGTDPRTRGALLDEQIETLKVIWTADEAEFHGKHIDFDPIFQWPKPLQRPHPPIYIGGGSKAAASRAVRLGDGWMPIAVYDPQDVGNQVALISMGHQRKLPITVLMAPQNPELLAAYQEAGVERVTLFLPAKEEKQALLRLDKLASVADHCGLLAR